jgi:hypothetical protein
MHDNYNPGPIYGESIGVNFLDTDGIEGLLFVAEKMGALLLAKPGEMDIGRVARRSQDIFVEQTLWDALRDAGRENPHVEAFRQASEASQKPYVKQAARAETPVVSYAELLKNITRNQPYLLRKWGEQASDQELELAARGLIAARDPKEQLRHVRIFARRRFPLSPNALVALADVEEERVGFWAVRALVHVVDSAVRELAFRLVKSDLWWRGNSIGLLNNNFEPGDHETVLDWFQSTDDREARHLLGTGLKEFWKQHPDEKTEVRMLQSLYEKDPCSHCRECAVKRLIELDALTEQMRAECAYDANRDIRNLVR